MSPVPNEISEMVPLEDLRNQLLAAAKEFTGDFQSVGDILTGMVSDVERAIAETVEIFPVCHHSPSSAIHMIQRLNERPPKVIFMELCEDLMPCLDGLQDCKLPVALQAFAESSTAFPAAWSPLSVVAPITEASAEYQAIAFAKNEGIPLVFVDRSVDHVYQWLPEEKTKLPTQQEEMEEERDEAKLHGSAHGVQMGSMEPTFDDFLQFLLKNAQVRHFSEWWDQYVEQTLLPADYQSYRQIMVLVGSLLRRLGREKSSIDSDEQRERFMWQRMKDYIQQEKVDPKDTLYICGAIHAASDIEEFGIQSKKSWSIPPRSDTKWLYGIIPSSFSAIEYQFGFPQGTVSLSEASWKKALQTFSRKPFTLAEKKDKKAKKQKKSTAKPSGTTVNLQNFLTTSPDLQEQNEEQLLQWCTHIVALARKNGYLASTADSIAIYQTSILLGQMRNRNHPSPYDFQDAAITCLEKDRTPKKRNIKRLTEILLGGDRIGTVGYDSVPPLVQNIYDRLEDLKLDLLSKTKKRALLDFRQKPELKKCSDLLWKIHYLNPGLAYPIMGEKKLGAEAIQESWDLSVGRYQGQLIQLAYEGVSIEQVLEKRLKKKAFGSDSKTTVALAATEDSILYLNSLRLTEELGLHSISLLLEETGGSSAPEIFQQIRRLVHYYRTRPDGLPEWLRVFVAKGYSHYATLLPFAFEDRGTLPEQLAGMLSFVFTLESLALSLGCNRGQLVIAIHQASSVAEDPEKMGLLWISEWLLGQRDSDSIRNFFEDMFENPMMLSAFHQYMEGFLMALKFTPLAAPFVVELLSKAFAKLPDHLLIPWMPGLIMMLRPHVEDLVPNLLKEAGASFPTSLLDLENFRFPWEKTPPKKQITSKKARYQLSPNTVVVQQMLKTYPKTIENLAVLLEQEVIWEEVEQNSEEEISQQDIHPCTKVLQSAPDTTNALAELLGQEADWLECKRKESNEPDDSIVSSVLKEHGETLEHFAKLINSSENL